VFIVGGVCQGESSVIFYLIYGSPQTCDYDYHHSYTPHYFLREELRLKAPVTTTAAVAVRVRVQRSVHGDKE
jgi:hypothetical protein